MTSDPGLDLVLGAARAMPTSGRYGAQNVFVSALWDRVGSRLGMSLDQFKRWLLAQNRQQHLTLGRADLIDDMDPDQVERSEIEDLGSYFHFVLDRGARHRERTEDADVTATPRIPRGSPGPRAPRRRQMEKDIARIARSRAASDPKVSPRDPGLGLYYPGGLGGGGGRRRRKGASPVALPHGKTSRGCKLCSKYHTTAEHLRHGEGPDPAKRKNRKPKKKRRTKKPT